MLQQAGLPLCSDKHLGSRDARQGAQELLPKLLRCNCLQTSARNNPVPLSTHNLLQMPSPCEAAEEWPASHGGKRQMEMEGD